MTPLIVKAKNKREEKIVKAFLDSLEINYTQANEDAALYKAMMEGKKSGYLNEEEKRVFIEKLRNAR